MEKNTPPRNSVAGKLCFVVVVAVVLLLTDASTALAAPAFQLDEGGLAENRAGKTTGGGEGR